MWWSPVGLDEFYEEGVWFFWDLARAAELVWLCGFVLLFLHAVRPSQTESINGLSTETLGLYCFVHIAKSVLPQLWRFHEAGFLDPLSACASLVSRDES